MKHCIRYFKQTCYWFILIFISTSCKKNEEYILQQRTPITTGIQLKINGSLFEKEAFGIQCAADNTERISISNNPELLSQNVDPTTLQSGDFLLMKQNNSGSAHYLIYFIYTTTNNGVTDIVFLVDDLEEIDEFAQGDNYAQGAHHGTFESLDPTIQVDYELSFASKIDYDADLCP